jgi:SAM-dependent methyltransferase
MSLIERLRFVLPACSVVCARAEYVYKDKLKLNEEISSEPCRQFSYITLKVDEDILDYGEVLEVGCGSEPATNGTRIDLLDQRGLRNFRLGSAYSLPYPDKSFDWIFCYHVLEHLDYPAEALAEFRRVARVGLKIRVPWKFFAHGCPDHKCSFDSTWFRKAFPNDFVTTRLELSFCHYSPIFVELTVRVEWRIKNELCARALV